MIEKEGGAEVLSRCVLVKALENGVRVTGLTRGDATAEHHSITLESGEVLVAQFTASTAAMRITGRAEVSTEVGRVVSGDNLRAGFQPVQA